MQRYKNRRVLVTHLNSHIFVNENYALIIIYEEKNSHRHGRIFQ